MIRSRGAFRLAIACLVLPALAGCGQSLATDVQEAQLAYGIAKGVAQQAVTSNPSLAPTVQKVEAVADPLAAAVSADSAPTLASLAQSLLVATAQDVTVTPNPAPQPPPAAAIAPAAP